MAARPTHETTGSVLIDRILELATGARAVMAVAALALFGVPLFRVSPYEAVRSRLGGATLPEETITSADRFAEVLGLLGEFGRRLYLQFQVWDLLNPILIGIAGAMVLGWLLKRSRRADSGWRFVVLFPVAALCADLTENFVISMSIAAYPDFAALGSALPFVTAAKFGAVMTMMVSVAVLALLWTRDWLIRRDSR